MAEVQIRDRSFVHLRSSTRDRSRLREAVKLILLNLHISSFSVVVALDS